MAKLVIEIRNGETSFKKNISYDGRLNKSKAFGTALSDFFKLVDVQSKGAVKLFKMNQAFDLIVKYGNVVIDTTTIRTELKTKFKLNKTAKRQRKFAQNVWAVLDYVTTETKVVTVDELIESLAE